MVACLIPWWSTMGVSVSERSSVVCIVFRLKPATAPVVPFHDITNKNWAPKNVRSERRSADKLRCPSFMWSRRIWEHEHASVAKKKIFVWCIIAANPQVMKRPLFTEFLLPEVPATLGRCPEALMASLLEHKQCLKNKAMQSGVRSLDTCSYCTTQWEATKVHVMNRRLYKETLRITHSSNCVSNPSLAIDNVTMQFLGYPQPP